MFDRCPGHTIEYPHCQLKTVWQGESRRLRDGNHLRRVSSGHCSNRGGPGKGWRVGELIAAHVLTRPGCGVLAMPPKTAAFQRHNHKHGSTAFNSIANCSLFLTPTITETTAGCSSVQRRACFKGVRP
jgi:hypothetical protein